MEIFDNYFKFPILMIDEMNEVRKHEDSKKYGDLPGAEDDEDELDLIVGEAEVQENDTILAINDKWKPTKASFRDAQDAKFDCCNVIFSYAGSYWVPMNKEKFKKMYTKFMNSLPEKPQPMVVTLSKKAMAELVSKLPKKDDPDTQQ